MAYERERDAAVEAAIRAGGLIRQHAGRLEGEAVREKGLHDLVTFVDEEAQRLIIETLHAAFPQYGVLAEEGAASAAPEVAGGRWIIDPVDGTTNFAHGVPPYAVSIGLQVEEGFAAGVVYDVARNELFTATRGGGVYVDGRPARASRERSLARGLVTTGFPYREFGHIDAYLEVLRRFTASSRGVRRPGSAAVDLAYVACGRFEGFFEIGLSPWDVAAGALLVQEAGGRVTDFRGGADFLFGGELVASNGLVHDHMLELVAPLRERGKERRSGSVED